jgi:hypothetical protein
MSAHLTETDLEALVRNSSLGKEQGAHLDTCASCQALVERLPEFDPERGARLLVRAAQRRMFPRPWWRRTWWSEVLAIAIILFAVMAATIVAAVSQVNGFASLVDFEAGETKAAEKDLSTICGDYLELRARASAAGLPLRPIPESPKDWPICRGQTP